MRRLLLLAIVALALPAPTYAAFPGQNGKIAFTHNSATLATTNADGSAIFDLPVECHGGELEQPCDAAYSPHGKIAYAQQDGSDDEGVPCGQDIHTVNEDGSGNTRLTFGGSPGHCGLDNREPAWSPDGTQIAFVSFRDGNAEIYTMNADGSAPTRRTNDGRVDLSPAWSPDGSKIAFFSSRDGDSEIYTMNLDGTGITQLTNNSTGDVQPDWSPDGKRLVFLSGSGSAIHLMDADGSNEAPLPNAPSSEHAVWSPDGKKIAFDWYAGLSEGYRIVVIGVDGTGMTTLPISGHAYEPSWGRRLHDHPQSAATITEPLVPAFRQTISASQCPARGGLDSTHGAPLSFSSCNPPGYLPGTQARLGPAASGSVQMTAMPSALTPGDQADVALALNATDVRNRSTGADYDPNSAGPDATLTPLIRLTDTNNVTPAATPATTADFVYPFPVNCVSTSDPSVGSTCSASSSFDAITPGAVSEYRTTTMSVARLWLYDVGQNGTRGDGDDRQFAQSGIYIP